MEKRQCKYCGAEIEWKRQHGKWVPKEGDQDHTKTCPRFQLSPFWKSVLTKLNTEPARAR